MDCPIAPQSSAKDVPLSTGLTSDEARRRLEKFGPNAIPDTAPHPLRRALTKFWAPVPWMLEAAIVLEIVLGKYVEAAIIAALLAFNAILGFFQEGRAQATLAALKSRLALNASVRRDNVWVTVPATGLVPGDTVKLSVGAVVAADVRLTEGQILLDQFMLTGDLLGMSLTTDNVRPSPRPNAWRIGELTIAGVFTGISGLIFCSAVLAIANYRLGLGIDMLRTLAFVAIVLGNQATTYTNRERQRLGSARPSGWLIGSSVVDVTIASTLATCGIAITRLPIVVVGGILVAAAVFAFILDVAKVPVFKRLRIA